MNLKTVNILLADDDSDDCFFFKKALEDLMLPANLTIVNDGEQLMNYLTLNTSNPPDILFLDLSMPRKNGLECISEIKRNKLLRNLAVVILSTSNSNETINNVFRRGVNVYIHKPGDFEQLKQVIHHALPIVSEKESSESQVKYILNA
ncbi:MAG: response regulator [Bacteroidales bacterium]|nr:response regulator [Bacteroidales bacterium]MBK8881779.1 response regulator [Bacteroidales bacterium]